MNAGKHEPHIGRARPALRLVKTGAGRNVEGRKNGGEIRMSEQNAEPAPTSTDAAAASPATSSLGDYLLLTVSRPPRDGQALLCLGSAIFELTLFGLLP